MKKLTDTDAQDAALRALRTNCVHDIVVRWRETLALQMKKAGFVRLPATSYVELAAVQPAGLSYRKIASSHVREGTSEHLLEVCATLWVGARPARFGSSHLSLEVLALGSQALPQAQAQSQFQSRHQRTLVSLKVASTETLKRAEREELAGRQLRLRLQDAYLGTPETELVRYADLVVTQLQETLAP